MLKQAWQSGLLQFLVVLSAVAWGFVFLSQWLEKVPDQVRWIWLSGHWWQIAIGLVFVWVLRARESNRWFSGFKHGYVVARARDIANSRAAQNRQQLLGRMQDDGFLV